jgi:hypothetical protein
VLASFSGGSKGCMYKVIQVCVCLVLSVGIWLWLSSICNCSS